MEEYCGGLEREKNTLGLFLSDDGFDLSYGGGEACIGTCDGWRVFVLSDTRRPQKMKSFAPLLTTCGTSSLNGNTKIPSPNGAFTPNYSTQTIASPRPKFNFSKLFSGKNPSNVSNVPLRLVEVS